MKDENEHIPFNSEPGNFGLPGGYFQKSATSIFNKIEWQEEHKDFPKLTELKHQNTNYGFNVPVEYFAKSAEHFENLRYPALFSLKRNSGFSVPADYFEQAEVNELGKVLSDAKDELFSFENLTSLTKENNFKVDGDFFERSDKQIHSLLEKPAKGRVINLFMRRIAFAGAALLVVSLGLWIYNFYFATAELKDCGTMACIDKQDLVMTKNLESMDNEELYELVNSGDLEKKLDIKEQPKNKETKDSSLKELSTDDLLDEI